MSREPVVVSLPPFHGVTRRLVLAAVGMYLLALVFSMTAPGIAALLVDRLSLHPDQAFGLQLWQFFTYPFVDGGLLSILFATLSLWFFGSTLEGERGPVWMREYFFASTIGGGLLAAALSRTVLHNVPQLDPLSRTYGLWPGVMALLLAYARFHPDQELTFNFILRVRAKFLAAIYLLIYLAQSLTTGHRFDALVTLCAAGSGFLYLRFAPRRGLSFGGSEWLYSLRNARDRRKRQQAAQKFTVYMRKQGKDVSLDPSGRYVSLDDERGKPRDPNDKRWMN